MTSSNGEQIIEFNLMTPVPAPSWQRIDLECSVATAEASFVKLHKFRSGYEDDMLN